MTPTPLPACMRPRLPNHVRIHLLAQQFAREFTILASNVIGPACQWPPRMTAIPLPNVPNLGAAR